MGTENFRLVCMAIDKGVPQPPHPMERVDTLSSEENRATDR